MIRFYSQYFCPKYDPTIEDYYRIQFYIDDKSSMLEIWDTCTFNVSGVYVKQGHGFILAYDITLRHTYDDIISYREQIIRENEKSSMVLCGTKCDLQMERKVPTAEAHELARQWNIPFFETSAKEGDNVKETFFQLVRDIRKTNIPVVTERSNCIIV